MSPDPDPVVISGIGLVTPLGGDAEALWSAVVAGRSAARPWDDLEQQGFPITTACRVTEPMPGDPAMRGANMAVLAASRARDDAGLEPGPDVGVFIGTTLGESAAFEGAAPALPRPDRGPADGFPRAVARALGCDGPRRAYATACAAGNYAIGAAAAEIAGGRLRAALAGGVEPFSRIALLGFSRLRAMAEAVCRPFDAGRDGMQLGEAAAFVVLERASAARARGIEPVARVLTLGLACDADHPTRPRADGLGMALSMEQALRQADLTPADVGWICAHGSGTVASDAAEARALRRVFGDAPPPCSGIKGALGHSLGAATAVEAVVTALALRHRLLPPTAHFRQADPGWGLDVVREARPAPDLRRALNCGFAFGGLDAALLMERVDR